MGLPTYPFEDSEEYRTLPSDEYYFDAARIQDVTPFAGNTGSASVFAQDTYRMDERALSMNRYYTIYDANEQPLLQVKPNDSVLRSGWNFYDAFDGSNLLLTLRQDHLLAFFTATYTLTDSVGAVIGTFEYPMWRFSASKIWTARDATGATVATAAEDAVVTYFHDLDVVRPNYFLTGPGSRQLGQLNRRLSLVDKYTLDLTPDFQKTFDRRLAVALLVLMDTGKRT